MEELLNFVARTRGGRPAARAGDGDLLTVVEGLVTQRTVRQIAGDIRVADTCMFATSLR